MRRKAIEHLIKWKEYENRKPVLITGAKGVGKTYLAYDFSKSFFQHIHYINFERDEKSKTIFACKEKEDLLRYVKEYLNYSDNNATGNNILILDEISFCPDITFGLEVLLQSGDFPFVLSISSNPVPNAVKEQFLQLNLYPLEFDEFLLATANEWYIEAIITHFEANKKLPEIVHKELLTLHQLYMQIGGMPGIVNEYLNFSSDINIGEQHNLIISAYHDNILKESPDDALKMNQVLDSLSSQLKKENRKFQYKLIRKGTTHAMYKEAIEKLVGRNYVLKSCKLSDEQLHSVSETFQDPEWQITNTNFKLYYPDTGIFSSKIAEEEGRQNRLCWNQALLENYVAQSLQAKGYSFGFWESNSMAKIDFIYEKDHTMIPVELFDTDNTRSKSIHILKQKCNFPYAIKISSKNFSSNSDVRYVPYYAVFCL